MFLGEGPIPLPHLLKPMAGPQASHQLNPALLTADNDGWSHSDSGI